MIISSEASIALWVFLAFAVERLVEIIVRAVPYLNGKKICAIEVPFLLSFIMSLVTAIGAELNFFELFQIPFRWPYVGYVFTALVMTGGSNLIHDIAGWVRTNREISRARASRMLGR